MKLVLAIDQGTTGTTVLALDQTGRVRGRGYAELPQHYPRPGWVEHDGEEIWRSVGAAVRRSGVPGRDIEAIGITNQRETTLLWDRRTSRPLARAIVWQCRRTTTLCEALKRGGWEPLVRKRTGLLLDPYFSGTKVAWLLRHVRGAARRAARGELAFGTVDTWLVWRLTAGRAHVTDHTNASRTLLFDIGKRRWDRDLLDLFDAPAALLPEVRASSGPFGETRGVPGLRDGIPILGIAGDQQAALYGQGCFAAGQAKNTYGTGCFLLLQTGDTRPTSKHGLLTTLACDARGGPTYALEGAVFIAGAVVQWLRDGMGIVGRAAESEKLARSVPDTLGTVLVPAFVGLGAPYWRPDARGAWLGLTRGVTRAHLVRAALESIAFQTRDVVDAMVADSGRRLSALRVDGGAAANDFLMQFQADVLGRPIQRPKMLETTALGAAALAARAAGLWPSGRAPGATGAIDRVFRPRVSRRQREEMVAHWQAAVARLLA
ncbi:MAG TPA: glycerol kinase GlpK [Candidatus Eisenbacteria bacterium]|nr:glycerol kinase GlpK [Candidatus Eisenbacteria bacterium]